MGLGNFLKQVGGGIASGVGWLGRRVVRPLGNFLKQVPIVGDVVRAAEPLGNAIQKSADYSADFYRGVPEGKRRPKPTGRELIDAVGSVPKTFAAGAAAAPMIMNKLASYA